MTRTAQSTQSRHRPSNHHSEASHLELRPSERHGWITLDHVLRTLIEYDWPRAVSCWSFTGVTLAALRPVQRADHAASLHDWTVRLHPGCARQEWVPPGRGDGRVPPRRVWLGALFANWPRACDVRSFERPKRRPLDNTPPPPPPRPRPRRVSADLDSSGAGWRVGARAGSAGSVARSEVAVVGWWRGPRSRVEGWFACRTRDLEKCRFGVWLERHRSSGVDRAGWGSEWMKPGVAGSWPTADVQRPKSQSGRVCPLHESLTSVQCN